jgi:hypothetical protein
LTCERNASVPLQIQQALIQPARPSNVAPWFHRLSRIPATRRLSKRATAVGWYVRVNGAKAFSGLA